MNNVPYVFATYLTYLFINLYKYPLNRGGGRVGGGGEGGSPEEVCPGGGQHPPTATPGVHTTHTQTG